MWKRRWNRSAMNRACAIRTTYHFTQPARRQRTVARNDREGNAFAAVGTGVGFVVVPTFRMQGGDGTAEHEEGEESRSTVTMPEDLPNAQPSSQR